MLGARNQLRGTIKSVKLGNVMAKVLVQVGENEIVAAITRGSAERMDLNVGDVITVISKATKVMVEKE